MVYYVKNPALRRCLGKTLVITPAILVLISQLAVMVQVNGTGSGISLRRILKGCCQVDADEAFPNVAYVGVTGFGEECGSADTAHAGAAHGIDRRILVRHNTFNISDKVSLRLIN
jgi:hypothetical protein